MRFLRLGVLGTTLLAASSAAGQTEAPPPNVVEADLGSGVVGVGYERVFTRVLSARFTAQLSRPWYTGVLGGDDSDVVGLGGELRPYFFLFCSAPAGLYISPFVRLAAIRAEDDLPEPASGLGFSVGATAGYGWLLLDNALLLRFGVGPQYWDFEVEKNGVTTGVKGVYPDVDIIAGYAF